VDGQRFIAGAVISWVLNIIALGFCDWIFDGVEIDGWGPLLIGAAVLGVVNWIVKPIVTFLAIPLILITLGIALFFISMFMLWITASIVDGFNINGFWTYVGATIVVWFVNAVLSLFAPSASRNSY
jgi:putative membrane protein